METRLGAAAFFLFLFLTVLSPPVPVLCQHELEGTTVYQLEVHIDGSATWIIERRFLLATDYDRDMFFQYASPESLDRFYGEVQANVSRASINTGRDMQVPVGTFRQTFSITPTPTGFYGVLKYQYDWLGFARVEDRRIAVGDAFEGGLCLQGDDVLILQYPEGYVVQAVSPPPNATVEPERTLTWYGNRTFMVREPTVILGEEGAPGTTGTPRGYTPMILGGVVLAAAGSASLWFFAVKRKKRALAEQVPPVPPESEDDEDRIIALLKEAGGRSYQSAITERFGFSRSKTSGLLKAMEREGIVKRQRKGREKLVTLTDRAFKKQREED